MSVLILMVVIKEEKVWALLDGLAWVENQMNNNQLSDQIEFLQTYEDNNFNKDKKFIQNNHCLLHKEDESFMISRALHMASSGLALGMVSPFPSVMSISSSFTLFHSKH